MKAPIFGSDGFGEVTLNKVAVHDMVISGVVLAVPAPPFLEHLNPFLPFWRSDVTLYEGQSCAVFLCDRCSKPHVYFAARLVDGQPVEFGAIGTAPEGALFRDADLEGGQ